MSLKSTLETIAKEVLLMHFRYGSRPTLNLYDGKGTQEEDRKYCFWLLPIDTKSTVNEFGKITANAYDVAFFICIKSDFDGGTAEQNGEDYFNEKWESNIKPLYDQNVMEVFTKAFTCLEDYTFTNMLVREVINIPSFDFNMDGLYITITINEDLI